jgi:PAS domain S-box-containing protein
MIFPFYVRIGSDLRIISTGKSITKVIGNVDRRSFEEIFKFIRPSMSIQYDFQSMMEHQDIIIILESLEFPIKTRFRGQFIFREIENEIIYLNSPWITDSHDLGFHNLLISDFALHDTIIDNLQLLQSKQIVNEDMKKIADEMIIQRNELIKKNETIIELARFPDQNPQPIFRMDFDGKVLYANDPGTKLINQQNLLTLPFWGAIYLRFEANGYTAYEREFALAESIFHATIVPFKEKSYFNIYLRDITETLSFQNELINTTSRLQTLISSMHSAILAEDAERKIILVNQIFCDLFNVPLEPDQMKGIDCNESSEVSKVLFTDEQGFIDRINELLRNKKKVYGDVLNMKDGRVLERDYLPVFEDGEYTGHIWKYQDVTDLMQTKASLQKVEEKYKKIIENLKVGLIEVDLEQTITKVYPAFCQMTGYSEDELLGVHAYKLLVTDEDRQSLEYQNNSRKEGLSGVYETRIKAKDGTIKWVIISGTPIYDQNDKVIGSLGVHVDISDRKKLEEDLIEANEKSLSSVKLKQLFLANMSHEIRTPMNVIIGMAELMNENSLDKEQLKYLRTIKKSADNLLELINDLLDFSKIESGQFKLEDSDLNLPEMFKYLESSFYEKTKDKNIYLVQEVDPKISSTLIADSAKLNQVMVNLISNAVKFTNKGFIKYSCNLLKDLEDQQLIKFSVEDTGVGISKENQESIFEIFIQEDLSISRKYGGSGLGLSISQEIVEKMGGKINLISEKDKGSLFSFVISIKKGSILKEDKKNEVDKIEVIKTIKILVAEDNPLNQTLIKTILSKEGLNFELVENGQKVIEALSSSNYDIILMDIQMPIMDGVSAARHIRSVMGSKVPIIALTANASVEDEEVYRKAGMNGYISKPFRKEVLLKKIVECINVLDDSPVSDHLENLTATNEVLYSLDEIENIAGGDTAFVKSIIETYLLNTPKYLDRINIGIAQNDIIAIQSAAHQLKPSFDILFINKCSSLIRQLENECLLASPDMNLISSHYIEIKETIDKVILDLYSKY